MDRSTLWLTYTGRKSGHAFALPIRLAQDGDRVRLITAQRKPWWKNLGSGAEVKLWLSGEARTRLARVITLEREPRLAVLLAVYRGRPRRLAEQQINGSLLVEIQLQPLAVRPAASSQPPRVASTR